MSPITIFQDDRDVVIVLQNYMDRDPKAIAHIYERLGKLIDEVINEAEPTPVQPAKEPEPKLEYAEVRFKEGEFKGLTPEEVILKSKSVSIFNVFARMVENNRCSAEEAKAISRAIRAHLPSHISEAQLEQSAAYTEGNCNSLIGVAKCALSEEALLSIAEEAGKEDITDLRFSNIIEKRQAAHKIIEILLHLKQAQQEQAQDANAAEAKGSSSSHRFPDVEKYAKGEAVDLQANA